MFQNRSVHVLGSIACASLVVVVALQLFAGDEPDARAGSKDVQALLRERRAVLQEAARIAEEVFQAGRIPLASVIESQRELARADLDLAATSQERIAIYRRLVEQSTALEKATESQYKAAQATQLDMLKSTAARLQAQIELARAQSQAPETPAK